MKRLFAFATLVGALYSTFAGTGVPADIRRWRRRSTEDHELHAVLRQARDHARHDQRVEPDRCVVGRPTRNGANYKSPVWTVVSGTKITATMPTSAPNWYSHWKVTTPGGSATSFGWFYFTG